jgi:para-nitrobenzyl esterase
MGGSNLQDSNFMRADLSIGESAAKEQIAKMLGGDGDRIWSAYRSADPQSSPAILLARISSDRGVRTSTRTVIERKAALGSAPTFLYLLRWPAPFMNGRYGSVHGTDVPLIFHNPDLWPLTAGSQDATAVADRMAGSFIAFAKTGNPSTPDLPWPAYDPASRPTMVFDRRSGARNNPDSELLALLPGGGRQ